MNANQIAESFLKSKQVSRFLTDKDQALRKSSGKGLRQIPKSKARAKYEELIGIIAIWVKQNQTFKP